MDLITALALSIGVLGGIATFVLLSPFGLGMQIWVAFIAWATFYHCGGKEEGLTKALTNNIFGAVMALIALLLVTQIPLGGSLGVPLWAAICVLITVFILVYAAKAPALSDIPAGRARIRGCRRSRLDGQQAWRGHLGLAREPLRGWRDLPDHRRDPRLHFPEDRSRDGQGIARADDEGRRASSDRTRNGAVKR